MFRTIKAQFILILILCALIDVMSQTYPKEDWIPLFNGVDLNDWDIKIRGEKLNTDSKQTFKVVNGLLTVDYSKYSNFNSEPYGHIAYKKKTFSHYIIRVEYQFYDKQLSGGPSWAKENNGIMFHSQSMESMTLDQDFPNSVEVQLLGPSRGTTANMCSPGTYIYLDGKKFTTHCKTADAKSIQGVEWINTEVLVLGDSLVKHMVFGDTVLEYTQLRLDNDTKLGSGYIALQSESHPTRFKTVEILNLAGCMDSTKSGFRKYFVKSDPSMCKEILAGCTDSAALNFNPAATKDDGTCKTTALSKNQAVNTPEMNIHQMANSKMIYIDYAENYTIEVITPKGQLSASYKGKGKNEFALAAFKPGLYLINVKSPFGLVSRKITIH